MNFIRCLFCCCCNMPDDDERPAHPAEQHDHLFFDLEVDDNGNNLVEPEEVEDEEEVPPPPPVRPNPYANHPGANFRVPRPFQSSNMDDLYRQPLVRLANNLTEIDAARILQSQVRMTEVKRLAEGCYGSVFQVRASFIHPDEQLACKAYIFGLDWKENRVFEFRWKSFENETTLLQKVSHPNIIKFVLPYQVYCGKQDTETVFELSTIVHYYRRITCEKLLLAGFLMEKMDMTLAQWMEVSGQSRLNEKQINQLFIQIGGALQYLNVNHFACHHDLKPQNIGVKLITGQRARLVLLDFGNSLTYCETHYNAAENQANGFKLDMKILDVNQMIARRGLTNGRFDVVPGMTGRNGFLLEAYEFARMLMTMATWDGEWWDLHGLFTNFVTKCDFQDRRLKAVILRMIPESEENQVTINWAMKQRSGK